MLSLEEKATNYDTITHIHHVAKNINKFVKALLTRGENHDATKLSRPEVEAFTNAAPLKDMVYGSPEYQKSLDDLKPALEHHYRANSHHPQHYTMGIDGMSLVDIIEMFCDWSASSKRNKDGNLSNSIDINAERFNMSPQLVQIFKNSLYLLEN
jgi:Family of unknown function (DUF5662)